MVNEKRVKEIFDDAEFLYQEAMKELEVGKIRDAAEKAWGATLRATNALILARIGEEPERTPETSRKLRELAEQDGEIEEKLVGRYFTRSEVLHGTCFYLGICEPVEDIKRRIRDTHKYIEEARKLAKI